ncbi:MAG: DUF4136 domain-containing protein [Gammaproteobacteria bacterium]|nr:DUF4136 domain-containing protein [Gammaproteobacteria bacterium]
MRAIIPSTFLLAILSGCATTQVGSDYDRGASFTGYQTFTVMHRQHHGSHNPLVAQRAEDDIKSDLTAKGYRYTDDAASADFTVDFTIGSKERTDLSSYPAPYAGGWFGFGPWWGAPYWGNEVDVHQYRQGTLSIDVFDAHSHRPVWHGWAKKELSSGDLAQPAEPIATAVASVLAKFPPGGPAQG